MASRLTGDYRGQTEGTIISWEVVKSTKKLSKSTNKCVSRLIHGISRLTPLPGHLAEVHQHLISHTIKCTLAPLLHTSMLTGSTLHVCTRIIM